MSSEERIHVVIGDTQVRPGVPTAHLGWIGRYIVDQFAGRKGVRLIHLGDHWDFPSLSSYDRGKKAFEGRRYEDDVAAGNRGFDLLNRPLARYNAKRRRKWYPLSRDFILGNHEDRVTRACEDSAELDGALSLDHLNPKKWGWRVHEFKKPLVLDGVHYAHFFYHPKTGKPYGGENLHTRLKQIGHTFTMGHQQGAAYAMREVGRTRHHGLVLGSTYLHDERYLGPQTTAYWRGIVVCHRVRAGMYDPMFVSLEYLCQRYERKSLASFLKEVPQSPTNLCAR